MINEEQSPALRQAVENMATMREAYDNLSQAAEAYNTGKVELAANITSKGVQASANETLPELAEKVGIIQQESYTIDGGEMYAKQLFGSLETPNYWNLYEILAQLLSDGRLVQYGGILLAEYYKGYDSLALSGAGAGGAYVVSDIEDGQFKMYTEDTTHIWATEFDGKGNRWVAYCFADEYHDFQITVTNTSPRSIFIGRKVGTITSLVNGRVSQIVVPDGNYLRTFGGAFTQNFGRTVVIRNLYQCANNVVFDSPNVELIYIGAKDIVLNQEYAGVVNYNSGECYLNTLVIECESIIGNPLYVLATRKTNYSLIIKSPYIYITNLLSDSGGQQKLQNVTLITESCYIHNNYNTSVSSNVLDTCTLGYITNDKTKSVQLAGNLWRAFKNIILQQGWCKPLDISTMTSAITENIIYTNILQQLKQDETDCGDGVTITLGSTNLAKLTSEESVQLLDDLTNIYGYTFA